MGPQGRIYDLLDNQQVINEGHKNILRIWSIDGDTLVKNTANQASIWDLIIKSFELQENLMEVPQIGSHFKEDGQKELARITGFNGQKGAMARVIEPVDRALEKMRNLIYKDYLPYMDFIELSQFEQGHPLTSNESGIWAEELILKTNEYYKVEFNKRLRQAKTVEDSENVKKNLAYIQELEPLLHEVVLELLLDYPYQIRPDQEFCFG